MISSDFVHLTAGFLDETPQFDYLLKLLNTIVEGHQELRGKVFVLAQATDNSNQVMPAHVALTRELRSLANTMRSEFDSRKVWAGVEDLGRRARTLGATNVSQEIGENVANRLSRFSDAYEQYIKTYSVEDTYTVIDTGNDLYLAVDQIRMMAVLARDALLPVLSAGEGEAELTLSFSSSPTFEEFVAKLTALSFAYQKLCELMKISPANYPLRIAKVETGTWIAKVIGSLPVVGVMTQLLEKGAGYLYRNSTTEGKISGLPRKAEAVEAVLGLKKLLDQANVDTSEMDENIRNAAVLLSQELNTLFGGEPRVAINNIEIDTDPRSASKNLLGDRHLLEDLQGGSNQSPETSEGPDKLLP